MKWDNGDLPVMCYALVKAMAYECDNAKYDVKRRKKEGQDDITGNAINSIRFFQKVYAENVSKIVRDAAKHRGGIYRKGIWELGRTCKSFIDTAADNAIKEIEKELPSE